MLNAVIRMHLRQVFAGKKLWIFGLALGLPWILLAMVAAEAVFHDPNNERMALGVILFLIYGIGIPALSALMYGTSIIGAEVQNQTLTYLFTRPVARWRIVVGKYLANVGVLTVGTVLSLTVGWMILGAKHLSSLYAVSVAAMAAVITYNAVFALIGTMFPRRSLVVGLIYTGVSEGALATVPSLARNFTGQFHTRTIAFDLSGISEVLPFQRSNILGDATLATAIPSLAAMTIVTLTLTCWLTTTREFALTDDP